MRINFLARLLSPSFTDSGESPGPRGKNDRLVRICRFIAVLLLVLVGAAAARADNPYFVSYYYGVYTDTALNELLRLKTDFKSSYIHVLSVGREIGQYKDLLAVELEGQVGVHSGMQSHVEMNGAFTLRWLAFPWDRYLDTSFAFGNGVSYAFKDPPLEIEEGDEGRTSQWLYYILVEFAFALPSHDQWELFVRAHHRSSVFGAIDGLFTASNFAGAGIRYRF